MSTSVESALAKQVGPRGRLVALILIVLASVIATPSAHAADRIYWSNYDDRSIAYADIDGAGGGGTVNTGGATVLGPMGLTMDPARGLVYWSNWAGDTGTTISYAHLDGSGGGDLEIQGATISGPHGLAIDPSVGPAGRIYWPNHANNTISYADLDGNGGGTGGDLAITNATVDEPRGMMIDPIGGRVYWSNFSGGDGTTISYANLDGSGDGDLLQVGTNGEGPEGTAIDPLTRRIYWSNPGNKHLLRYAELDGSGVSIFDPQGATARGVHGVAIDPDTRRLYWANYNSDSISYASLDGNGGGDLNTSGTTANGPNLPALLKAPSGTGVPEISGSPDPGATLQCSPGTWAGDVLESLLYRAPKDLSYQWILDGAELPNAETDSLTASSAGTYRCRVTATNAAGSTSQTSEEHVVGESPPPTGVPTTLSFQPEADTYVSSKYPTSSFGSATDLIADRSPARQTFLRFDVEGLEGRDVIDARLRMNQTNGSDEGGQVFKVSSNDWSEAMTWNERPAIDGPQLGSFGPVATGGYYESDLGPTLDSDGPLTLAVASTSADDSRWASRENGSLKAPRLILTVESGDRVDDGLSQVASPTVGSSSPTYYGNQHHLAITEAGRLLAVHGLHATGVELAWRDPAGNWQNETRGEEPNGTLLAGAGTGDFPASIAVAPDSGGEEHAWVVFSRAGYSSTKSRPVYMRRLSELDSPSGPRVGPLVTIDSPAFGAFQSDVAFEETPSGPRGVILWSRKASDGSYQTVTGWFTDLDSDAPIIHHETVIDSGTSSSRWGTLVPGSGMKIVARLGSNAQLLVRHEPGTPLDTWTRGPAGVRGSGHGSAVSIDTGETINVLETDLVNHIVRIQRFSPTGDPAPVELTLTGYSNPTVATDGRNIWVVMVRQSDGYIVSRQYRPLLGWTSTDRVEVGPEGGGYLNYPNALSAAEGRLRLLIEGPGTDPRSSVLAFQRGL